MKKCHERPRERLKGLVKAQMVSGAKPKDTTRTTHGAQETKMTTQMQSEIGRLSTELEEIDDPRESFALVKERIARLRAAGNEIPQELERLEKVLAAECRSASQGR